MRRIAVVTTSRADYGIYKPLLACLKADPEATLMVVVGGMHLRAEYGNSINEIEADGHVPFEQLDFMEGTDSGLAVAQTMGRATIAFAEAFERLSPDMIVVLGDRYEMHSAAVAAQPLNIPIAHLHGGELTQGAMDDNLRHAMTKLSHLHFVSTEAYAKRVRQLGEEDWRVTVSGAMGLDNLALEEAARRDELEERLGMSLEAAPLLVTYHPATRQKGDMKNQTAGLFEALDRCGLPCIFTAPNADEGGRKLRELIESFVDKNDKARLVENLGTKGYFGLMKQAAAMVGNSSSGIIEAASFELPVVNIGTRQEGRVRAMNVIDVDESADSIEAAIIKTTSGEFRDTLRGLQNPYKSKTPAAEIIHKTLMEIPLDERLIKKCFADRN